MPAAKSHPRSPSDDTAGSIRDRLSGGNPRSLGNTPEIVALVLGEPDRLEELIACILDEDDQIVRMRASDARARRLSAEFGRAPIVSVRS